MCLSCQGAPSGCLSYQWQGGGLKALSHGSHKTLITYKVGHFRSISTAQEIWQLWCGQLQLRESQPMDWPIDAESPCSAAVTQRTVRKWHCRGLELGKVGQLRLLPIFTSTLCHGCFLSTHSFQHIILRVYLLIPASLWSAFVFCGRATECSHLEPPACSFQLSGHPRAVLLSSHQHLPACRGWSHSPNSKIPLCLVLWQALLGCTEEHAPLLFSSAIFSFGALVSLLLPPGSIQALLCIAVARSFRPPAFLLLQLE